MNYRLKLKRYGTLLLLALTATLYKADAQVYSLQAVLDSIAARNPGLQQYALKTEASNALAGGAKAWEPPKAGFGLSEFPYPSKMDNSMARKMLMLRVEQMFPAFSRQKAQAAYYKSLARQDRDDLQSMKNMLFTKAKTAYYTAAVSEKKLAVLDEQEKQLQLLLKIMEGRLAYNKAGLPNIYNARARLSDLQSMRIKEESMIRQGITVMNTLMNRPPGSPLQPDTAVTRLEYHNEPLLALDSAYVLQHRSDIQKMSHDITSMELKKKITATMGKPMWGISFDNMRMNNGMYMYSAMAMVTIPIVPWSSGGYKSEIRSMNYEIEAMQKAREGMVLETVGNIQKDWLALQAQYEDLRKFRTEVIPAYEKTYQANLNAFSENTGDIYQTLMAWDDLTMKKMEYFDKVGEAYTMEVMLEMEMQQY